MSLFIAGTASMAERISIETEDFKLWDSGNVGHTLSYYSDKAFIVLIAFPQDCASEKQIFNWYSKIERELWKRNAAVLWINARSIQDREAVKTETREEFFAPVLMDDSQVTSRRFKFVNSGDYVVLRPSDWEKLMTGNWSDGGIETLFDIPKEPKKAHAVACPLKYRDRSHLTWDLKMAERFHVNCGKCHMKFSYNFFQTDEDVFNWRSMSLLMMRLGKMPVGGFDPATPNCGYYFEKVLQQRELSTIENWLDMGAPHSKAKTSYIADLNQKWRQELDEKERELGKPTLFWKANENDEIPADGPDLFRAVQVAGPLEEDIKVSAVISLDRTDSRHHLHLYSLPEPLSKISPKSMKLTTKFHGDEILPYLKVIVNEDFPNTFPRATPIFRKGSYVVFESHYHPTGRNEFGRPHVAIFTTKKSLPERRIAILSDITPPLLAKQKNQVVSHQWLVSDDIRLLQIQPHTHTRGRRYELKMTLPNGRVEDVCRLETFRIGAYPALSKPLAVPKGSILRTFYTFDNSEQNPLNPNPNENVEGGSTFKDEMATTRFFYVLDSDVPVPK